MVKNSVVILHLLQVYVAKLLTTQNFTPLIKYAWTNDHKALKELLATNFKRFREIKHAKEFRDDLDSNLRVAFYKHYYFLVDTFKKLPTKRQTLNVRPMIIMLVFCVLTIIYLTIITIGMH